MQWLLHLNEIKLTYEQTYKEKVWIYWYSQQKHDMRSYMKLIL